MKTQHETVLLKETIKEINAKPGGVYVDVTLGGGGHALKLLEAMEYKGKLIVFDVDEQALERFKELISENEIQTNSNELEIILVNENFTNLKNVLLKNNIDEVDGIIADLGLSTDQYNDPSLGISFVKDSELDMRIDKTKNVKAKDLINGLYEKELIKLFEDLADISFARNLAKVIIKEREIEPIETTTDLKKIVQKVVPFSYRKGPNKNPEAKVFQALRIAINDELSNLRSFLPLALEALALGGRLAVISFHSGEDRIVKNFFREQSDSSKIKYVQKLLIPSSDEIERNPRSSSAKLRVVERIIK